MENPRWNELGVAVQRPKTGDVPRGAGGGALQPLAPVRLIRLMACHLNRFAPKKYLVLLTSTRLLILVSTLDFEQCSFPKLNAVDNLHQPSVAQ